MLTYQLILVLAKHTTKAKILRTLSIVSYFILKRRGHIHNIDNLGARNLMGNINNIRTRKKGIFVQITFSINPKYINQLKNFIKLSSFSVTSFIKKSTY